MIKWLLKNFGIAIAGFCVLFGMASLEMRLNSMETRLTQALHVGKQLQTASLAIGKYPLGEIK